MASLIFLGTAAALPTADRTNTTLAVLPDDSPGGLLIDCGGDVYSAMLRAGLSPDAVSDLLITHAHIDHIGSLPSLLESLRLGGRRTALRIWAIPEVLTIARQIVEVFSYELTLEQWTYDVSFAPIQPNQSLTLGGVRVRTAAMDHSVPSIGVRMELPHGPVAYTSDTQPHPAIRDFGRGARMLITECTFLRTHEAAARASKHMTAFEAGQQAAICGVETLALVHLGGGWSVDEARNEVAASFSGSVLIPADGDIVEV